MPTPLGLTLRLYRILFSWRSLREEQTPNTPLVSFDFEFALHEHVEGNLPQALPMPVYFDRHTFFDFQTIAYMELLQIVSSREGL